MERIGIYKIFESVARNESISKASEELFISQPAVSLSIKKLESELGANLFIRTKFGVKLTSEGKIFYDYIKNGLDFIDSGEKVFSHLKNLESGKIKIGASTTITKFILMPYLKQFHTKYPKIEIEIVNLLTNELLTKLKSGLVDIVVSNLPIENESELCVFPFKEVQDIFCSTSEYMDISKTYDIKTLENFNLIAQQKPSITRQSLDNFVKSQKLGIMPNVEVVSSSLVCELTKIGFGYGFLTKEFVLDELKNKQLFELKTNVSVPKRKIGIVVSNKHSLSFASQKFVDLILNEQKNTSI